MLQASQLCLQLFDSLVFELQFLLQLCDLTKSNLLKPFIHLKITFNLKSSPPAAAKLRVFPTPTGLAKKEKMFEPKIAKSKKKKKQRQKKYKKLRIYIQEPWSVSSVGQCFH